MNGQGQALSNDAVVTPVLARGQPSATPDTGLTNKPLVPDYELLRRIGGGAYGDVWLARNEATGILRAAKIVWRRTFDDDRPYQREFEGIQKFEQISREHPSQLALFHIGRNTTEGYFYYVMELADDAQAGHDTDSYLPRTLRADFGHGRLPAAQVLEIGLALTEALGHLHRNGLVHRDVKPSNVIFVNGRPKLADIGLVTDASDLCSIVGTEGYLPPEGPGTPQADIFALGKVLYEAATGLDRREFPDFPAEIRDWSDAALVYELNQIILKACSPDAQKRYGSTEAVRVDLERLVGGKSVRWVRRQEYGWQIIRRGSMWLAATAAVLVLVLLASRARQPATAPHLEKRSANETSSNLLNSGKTHFDRFTGTDFALAADYFQRAIQADTNFAQAYGYLAVTYTWSDDGWNPNWKLLPQAKEFALQALVLDQSLAEPHLALGMYHFMREWAWSDAEKEYQRALKLNPSSAVCHLCYAEFLRQTGRMPEAFKEINEAKALDPDSRIVNIRLADFLNAAKQFTNALKQVDQVLAKGPSTAAPYTEQYALSGLGRCGDAVDSERKYRIIAGESKERLDLELGELKRLIVTEGPRAYWQRELNNCVKWGYIYGQARAHVQLGETNAAFNNLNQCLKRRDVQLTFSVMTDWALDPIRSEPQFHAILKTMHLE